MSAAIQPQTWSHDGLEIVGVTLAGVGTCLTAPQHGVAFDVAQGLPFAFGMKHFFITHGHQDHAGGIPYLISQKAMANHQPPRFYVPPALKAPLARILDLWQGIEGHSYRFDLIPAEAGSEFEIKRDLVARPFPTIHRIPSNGYALFRRFKKLKPELHDRPGEELRRRRESGEEIHEDHHEPLFAFTGDTQIEFLERTPWLARCKVLAMEVTYIDDRKPVAAAREWGHIHLEELLPRLDELACERLLLIHLSARHRPEELKQVLQLRLPDSWRGRVDVFPRAATQTRRG